MPEDNGLRSLMWQCLPREEEEDVKLSTNWLDWLQCSLALSMLLLPLLGLAELALGFMLPTLPSFQSILLMLIGSGIFISLSRAILCSNGGAGLCLLLLPACIAAFEVGRFLLVVLFVVLAGVTASGWQGGGGPVAAAAAPSLMDVGGFVATFYNTKSKEREMMWWMSNESCFLSCVGGGGWWTVSGFFSPCYFY